MPVYVFIFPVETCREICPIPALCLWSLKDELRSLLDVAQSVQEAAERRQAGCFCLSADKLSAPNLPEPFLINRSRVHTKGVVRQHASKKGSEKVLETAFEKVLRRVLRRWLAVGFKREKGF